MAHCLTCKSNGSLKTCKRVGSLLEVGVLHEVELVYGVGLQEVGRWVDSLLLHKVFCQ
jgi:hypothetical protein